MLRTDPMIGTYMTRSPHSIDAEASIKQAQAMMKDYDIRHLPVTKDGKVVGILSDRDVKVAYGLRGVEPSGLPVSAVCQKDPYIVDSQALLRQVAHTMAVRHYGSIIVVDDGKLVGIFTTVDACRVLTSMIEARLS